MKWMETPQKPVGGNEIELIVKHTWVLGELFSKLGYHLVYNRWMLACGHCQPFLIVIMNWTEFLIASCNKFWC